MTLSSTVLGVALGAACAGTSKQTQTPMQCMQACEQERCEYRPDGVGDNTAYLECLEGCEKKCAK